MFAAIGKNGQILSIVPSTGIVFVRMGNASNGNEVPFVLCNEIWRRLNKVICPVTLLVANQETNNEALVYPNPCENQFTFQLPEQNFSAKAEVWIRCAPKRDPLEAVRRGQFRDDLCYQLHVIPITMPLMRDPRANVVDMAEVNLRRLSTKEHRSFTGFDRAVAELFKGLRWLVNLRQLLNVLWNRVALNQGRSLRFLCFHLKYPTRKTT